MDHPWPEYATSSHHDEHHAEIARLREEIRRYKADPTLQLAVDESKVVYFPEEES